MFKLAETKFKVGDKIKLTHSFRQAPIGATGIIKEIAPDDYSQYFVIFDTFYPTMFSSNEREGVWFPEAQLELIENSYFKTSQEKSDNVWYHGTSSINLPNVLKYGLVRGPGMSGVSFTKSFPFAEFFSDMSHTERFNYEQPIQRLPAILELVIPEDKLNFYTNFNTPYGKADESLWTPERPVPPNLIRSVYLNRKGTWTRHHPGEVREADPASYDKLTGEVIQPENNTPLEFFNKKTYSEFLPVKEFLEKQYEFSDFPVYEIPGVQSRAKEGYALLDKDLSEQEKHYELVRLYPQLHYQKDTSVADSFGSVDKDKMINKYAQEEDTRNWVRVKTRDVKVDDYICYDYGYGKQREGRVKNISESATFKYGDSLRFHLDQEDNSFVVLKDNSSVKLFKLDENYFKLSQPYLEQPDDRSWTPTKLEDVKVGDYISWGSVPGEKRNCGEVKEVVYLDDPNAYVNKKCIKFVFPENNSPFTVRFPLDYSSGVWKLTSYFKQADEKKQVKDLKVGDRIVWVEGNNAEVVYIELNRMTKTYYLAILLDKDQGSDISYAEARREGFPKEVCELAEKYPNRVKLCTDVKATEVVPMEKQEYFKIAESIKLAREFKAEEKGEIIWEDVVSNHKYKIIEYEDGSSRLLKEGRHNWHDITLFKNQARAKYVMKKDYGVDILPEYFKVSENV